MFNTHSLSISLTLTSAHPSLVRAFADEVGMAKHVAHVEQVIFPDMTQVAVLTAEGSHVDLVVLADRWSKLGAFPGMYASPAVLVPAVLGEVLN